MGLRLLAEARGSGVTLTGNGLPSSPTGTFPVASSDPAYQYDRNPNSIGSVAVRNDAPRQAADALPDPDAARPDRSASRCSASRSSPPSTRRCATRTPGRCKTAAAGILAQRGVYHFHSLPACFADYRSTKRHSKLAGYALDGFGIYGYRGVKGKLMDNAKLDVCHGHTHEVRFNGSTQRIYHYHATREFPYLVGCLPRMIDLRSDTVTRPSPEMREAMAAAEVGDDQFGEDPSVNRLQSLVAGLLGKEAALFVPSGTMANQLALKLYTRPGDDVIVSVESHAVWHETGAAAALNGVQCTEVGEGGLFTADDLRAAAKPRGHMLFPPTTLVEVENTHNRGGGLVFDPAELRAHRRDGPGARHRQLPRRRPAVQRGGRPRRRSGGPRRALRPRLDRADRRASAARAARCWRARRGDIGALVRYRRMLGGALRQSGFYAAAGIHALEHHVARLADDHANARLISERLGLPPGETNIAVFRAPAAPRRSSRPPPTAASRSSPSGPEKLRFVTHRDVSREDCERAADVLAAVV